MSFSRRAVINAHAALAVWNGEVAPLSPRTHKLTDVCCWVGRMSGSYTALFDVLDRLDLESVVAFFLLYAARDNAKSTAELCSELADRYARAHDPGGVEIMLDNHDDDPCMITLMVRDAIASAWADRHGSLVGGTLEEADGEDCVYDTTIWYPKLIDELLEKGLNLDLSDYADPEENEIRASAHAACDECPICRGSYERALEHFGNQPPLAQEAHLALTDQD